jgi:hypothetical protein
MEKNINIKLDSAFHDKVKKHAKSKMTTMAGLIKQLLIREVLDGTTFVEMKDTETLERDEKEIRRQLRHERMLERRANMVKDTD